MSDSVRRVVCAALRSRRTGALVVGVRHFSPDMRAQITARSDAVEFTDPSNGPEQGFVDQFGVFMDRVEAAAVARAAGQIAAEIRHTRNRGFSGEILFSEDLY